MITRFVPGDDYLSGFVRNYVNTPSSLFKFISSSSVSGYPLENLFNYSSDTLHWASTYEDGLKSYLKIKVCGFGLILSHFSIRSHNSVGQAIRNWVFEASRDGLRYDVLLNKTNSDDLISNALKLYEVNSMNKAYSSFRIRQTNVTAARDTKMRIGKIDFFGMLFSRSNCSCKMNKKNYLLCVFMVSFFLC